MFKTLINAWNVKDIRTKMLYTLLLVVIYRFGSFIPVPGVDASKIAAAADTYSILSFLNLLSGGNFGQFTIFAMGITPYITGSIIIQLLTIAIPSLEKMAKEEDGREKLERITRYTGIGLALVQSIGIVSGLQNQAQIVTNPGFLSYATIGIVCTAGTAFLVWLGERITEKGIGNGISFIIFAFIQKFLAQLLPVCLHDPVMVRQSYQPVLAADIGIRTNRSSQRCQIISVLQKLLSDRLVCHFSAFQFHINNLVLFDLNQVKFLSKTRNGKRIEKTKGIHFLHVQFQLIHERSHTVHLPVTHFQKICPSRQLPF